MEKHLFFWVATAGLGKYRTGGYGEIGSKGLTSYCYGNRYQCP